MIIAIGGVSNSGKTTLAGKVRKHYVGRKTRILCQDDFVKSIDQIPKIHNRVNWENPDSIDFTKLKLSIIAEKEENELLIVEGLMVFWDEEIVKLFDKKIFIEMDYSLFKKRKANDIRWGREPL